MYSRGVPGRDPEEGFCEGKSEGTKSKELGVVVIFEVYKLNN